MICKKWGLEARLVTREQKATYLLSELIGAVTDIIAFLSCAFYTYPLGWQSACKSTSISDSSSTPRADDEDGEWNRYCNDYVLVRSHLFPSKTVPFHIYNRNNKLDNVNRI